MPTYEYGCGVCTHKFEKILKIANMDDPLSEPCPACGLVSVGRVYGSQNLAFMSPESLGRHKAPGDFRNWLSYVKRANPGSSIKDH